VALPSPCLPCLRAPDAIRLHPSHPLHPRLLHLHCCPTMGCPSVRILPPHPRLHQLRFPRPPGEYDPWMRELKKGIHFNILAPSGGKEGAHWSSSSMGMSSILFQRFILASRLSNGRGPVFAAVDLELLLRTMCEGRKRTVLPLYSYCHCNRNPEKKSAFMY
jgi:hypothetical protein